MAKLVQVFDPPMCCSTGVCGPKVDKRLVQFAAALEWLRGHGVQVERYNPTQQYDAFVNNATVVDAVNTQGLECLPLILADGEIVSYGCYPGIGDLAVMAGLEGETEAEA